jgi:hypothetical protein
MFIFRVMRLQKENLHVFYMAGWLYPYIQDVEDIRMVRQFDRDNTVTLNGILWTNIPRNRGICCLSTKVYAVFTSRSAMVLGVITV